MSYLRRLNLLLMMLASVCVGLAACEQQPAEEAAGPERSQVQRNNDILESSTSPFEDLTEFAVAADEQGMNRALTAIENRAEVTRSALDAPAERRFDSLLSDIRDARTSGNYTNVALDAVETYRVLVESLDDEALIVPKAVSLLDYAGFRLNLLAGSAAPDWAAIQETTQEARGSWTRTSALVGNRGLRDVMDTTIGGMEAALEMRNAQMMVFVSQVDLDLVDLLESHFEEAGPVVQGIR